MTLVTDDFNRANNNSLGVNWNLISGAGFDATGFAIASNSAQPQDLSGDDLEVWASAPFADIQYAQAKITVTGIGNETGLGVALRYNTTGGHNLYRFVVCKAASNNVSLRKWVAGTDSLVTQRTTTWVDGDTLMASASGTTIRIFQNGVQLGADITDTSVTRGVPGICYSSSATSGLIEDFQAGDLTPADNPPFGFSGRGAGW